MENKPFGLIAGNGQFPLLFLKEANKKNIPCVVVALEGEADKSIEELSNNVNWVNIGHLNSIIAVFKSNKIDQAVMCGQVVHRKIFTEVKLDWRAIKLLASLKDKKTDTILNAVAYDLGREGVKLISSTMLLENYLPKKNDILSSEKPNQQVLDDIEFGYEIAKQIAGLDIGQTVVVKDKVVVAVESIEGTDACIKRAYKLAGDGIVIIKVNKPKQDPRFDVPVLGINTFNLLKDVKAKAIAFESGKTLFFNVDESVEIANENKIIVYAI
ncbi:LpxI family protein [bacterium]